MLASSIQTYTVTSTVLEDTAGSLFGVFRERGTVHEFWETAESHHLPHNTTTTGTSTLNHTLLLLTDIRSVSECLKAVQHALTWRRNVMGCWPMACASPMLALITSAKGCFTPYTQQRDLRLRRLRMKKLIISVLPIWQTTKYLQTAGVNKS